MQECVQAGPLRLRNRRRTSTNPRKLSIINDNAGQ
jgi:hypothetical protein